MVRHGSIFLDLSLNRNRMLAAAAFFSVVLSLYSYSRLFFAVASYYGVFVSLEQRALALRGETREEERH